MRSAGARCTTLLHACAGACAPEYSVTARLRPCAALLALPNVPAPTQAPEAATASSAQVPCCFGASASRQSPNADQGGPSTRALMARRASREARSAAHKAQTNQAAADELCAVPLLQASGHVIACMKPTRPPRHPRAMIITSASTRLYVRFGSALPVTCAARGDVSGECCTRRHGVSASPRNDLPGTPAHACNSLTPCARAVVTRMRRTAAWRAHRVRTSLSAAAPPRRRPGGR